LLHREFLHVEPETVLADRVDFSAQDLPVPFLLLGQREKHLFRLWSVRLCGQVEGKPVRDDLALDQ